MSSKRVKNGCDWQIYQVGGLVRCPQQMLVLSWAVASLFCGHLIHESPEKYLVWMLQFVIFLTLTAISAAPTPQLLHSWTVLDFDWQSPQQRDEYIQTGKFIPENNALTGIVRFLEENQ